MPRSRHDPHCGRAAADWLRTADGPRLSAQPPPAAGRGHNPEQIISAVSCSHQAAGSSIASPGHINPAQLPPRGLFMSLSTAVLFPSVFSLLTSPDQPRPGQTGLHSSEDRPSQNIINDAISTNIHNLQWIAQHTITMLANIFSSEIADQIFRTAQYPTLNI